LVVSQGTVQVSYPFANNIDYSLSAVVATMEDAADLSITGAITCNGKGFGGGATTFSDYPTNAATYGEIIAPHVGWNKTVALLRIYAVLVSRFE